MIAQIYSAVPDLYPNYPMIIENTDRPYIEGKLYLYNLVPTNDCPILFSSTR